ncbi:MAG: hypothetical protein AAFV98_01855 [Chloroflexota bacterium]
MVDYFTEVFPVATQHIGRLYAYKVESKSQHISPFLTPLLAYLNAMSAGNWVLLDEHLVADVHLADDKSAKIVSTLKERFPDTAKSLISLHEDSEWQPTLTLAAEYIAGCAVLCADDTFRQVLRQHGTVVGSAYVMRDYHVRSWVVNKEPALSFTVEPRTLYIPNVQAVIEAETDVLGLQVIDKTQPQHIGTIEKVIGTLNEHRERLTREVLSASMKDLIAQAADSEAVLNVQVGEYRYDVIASALNIILSPEQYPLFDLPAKPITDAHQMPPDTVAGIVSRASDILKDLKLIDSAYNSRTQGDLFIYLNHTPDIAFKNRVRPFKRETIAQDFIAHGMMATKTQFKDAPIRIAVINALDDTIATDFVEALRRQMERDFGLTIELIKERTVRVVSESNLASAVRVVEKENPHILLACFADDDLPYYEYVKSLTLGKGITLHALYESTMHNPDAMGTIMMGVLAKTGNIPYVLAEKLEEAELIVGLDWVRQQMTRGDRVVGMSRIYRRDGTFMRYFMDVRDLETDDPPPTALIQQLFPEAFFTGKRVIVHHYGQMTAPLLEALMAWADTLGATFMPVNITTDAVPHLYALENGIERPPWGSVFLLNNKREALVVSSSEAPDILPMPIHIHVPTDNVALDGAIYSVLAFTLLNYGTTRIPRLPVTIQNAEKISEWLARGMLPDNIKGDVPFWL